MDARRPTLAVALAALLSLAASYRTPNFVVNAPTQQIAEQVGRAAEEYRRQLADEWLGAAMPEWSQPCPIFVRVAPDLGAGGATSFNFHRGEVFGWNMTIQGSLERILDSVLPHEVTHTVFASHFRQPLPRWADEGACTTVEHASERANQQRMLIEFLRTGRGISFSHMFRMKEYPKDVLPLYAQGHSLASFLIAQGGKRKFLRYIGDGLKNEAWSQVTREYYGITNLGELQETWLQWVRRGSPPLGTPDTQTGDVQLASATTDGKRPRPSPNLLYRGDKTPREIFPFGKVVPVHPTTAKSTDVATRQPQPAPTVPNEGWHRPGQRPGRSAAQFAESHRNGGQNPRFDGTAVQATRPQRAQPAQEIILEWSRDSDEPPARPPVRYDAAPGRMLR